MPYVIGLESIGDTLIQARRRLLRGNIKLDVRRSAHGKALQLGGRERPWCAKIIGIDAAGKLKREFVTGMKTYEEANSTGNRGVQYWFVLRDGVYEIFRHETWSKSRRYFGIVTGDVLRELSFSEVRQCL